MDLSDLGHVALDLAGNIPVVGWVADGANAFWYAAEGNYVDAALSASAMVPVIGGAATAARAGKTIYKAADTATDTAKAADNATDAARAADNASTTMKTADSGSTATKSDSGGTSTPPVPDRLLGDLRPPGSLGDGDLTGQDRQHDPDLLLRGWAAGLAMKIRLLSWSGPARNRLCHKD